MTKSKVFAMINALVYGIMLFVNIAFQSTEVSTASVSDKYLTLITPSGITFMIWILIFGLLLIFTIKELMSDNDSEIGLLYLISSLLNIIWVVVWHYELIVVSLIVIIALAFVLYLIVDKLRKTSRSNLTKATFSIYYAWVSVASIVSIFVFITSVNNGVYNLPIVRLLSALTLCLLVVPLYLNRQNLSYIMVYIWAIIGIIIRHMTTFKNVYVEIIITAFVVLLACGGFVWNYFKERKRVKVQ